MVAKELLLCAKALASTIGQRASRLSNWAKSLAILRSALIISCGVALSTTSLSRPSSPDIIDETTIKAAMPIVIPSVEIIATAGAKRPELPLPRKRLERENLSHKALNIFYPKKANGERIKGFHNTYKRMKWDEPAPARAMNNGNMGGTNNIHPGSLLNDGTVSDARVLTLRELFIVSSLPADLDLPDWCTDNLIRTVIGEAIPPLFSYNFIKGIGGNND